MDNDSRTYYRKQVEKIAIDTNTSESLVARKAVICASLQEATESKIYNHIGYFLIGKGKPSLYKELSSITATLVASEDVSIPKTFIILSAPQLFSRVFLQLDLISFL